MDRPVDHYWHIRLQTLQRALEKNHFEAFVVDNAAQARDLVTERMLPEIKPQSVSWGGSMTFVQTGLYESLKERAGLQVIDTFEKSISAGESLERRRQALLADLFITGTNAVTEQGQLVNLDMIGNRVAALTFGPRHVVALIGRNKVVADVKAAMNRVKSYAAPTNVLRLDKPNPCAKTGHCQDCNTPERICNTWTITEKSFPKGRIRVILINADLGL